MALRAILECGRRPGKIMAPDRNAGLDFSSPGHRRPAVHCAQPREVLIERGGHLARGIGNSDHMSGRS